VDTQLTDSSVKRCPLSNKTQKCDLEKGIYIEFGKVCFRSALVELMYDAWEVMKIYEVQSLYKY